MYEQDWMYNEWQGLNATQHSPTLGRDWLLMMGKGESLRRSLLASGLQSSKRGGAVVGRGGEGECDGAVLHDHGAHGAPVRGDSGYAKRSKLAAKNSAVRWKQNFLAPTFHHP